MQYQMYTYIYELYSKYNWTGVQLSACGKSVRTAVTALPPRPNQPAQSPQVYTTEFCPLLCITYELRSGMEFRFHRWTNIYAETSELRLSLVGCSSIAPAHCLDGYSQSVANHVVSVRLITSATEIGTVSSRSLVWYVLLLLCCCCKVRSS